MNWKICFTYPLYILWYFLRYSDPFLQCTPLKKTTQGLNECKLPFISNIYICLFVPLQCLSLKIKIQSEIMFINAKSPSQITPQSETDHKGCFEMWADCVFARSMLSLYAALNSDNIPHFNEPGCLCPARPEFPEFVKTIAYAKRSTLMLGRYFAWIAVVAE